MLIDCNGLLLVIARVTTERAGRSKLTEFVTYHVLRDINRNELVSIVNCDCVTYKVRGNHRCAAPSLDNFFLAGLIHSQHLVFQLNVDKRSCSLDDESCNP